MTQYAFDFNGQPYDGMHACKNPECNHRFYIGEAVVDEHRVFCSEACAVYYDEVHRWREEGKL